MKAMTHIKELHEEMTCPICLEYFKEPVILACGHNFCRACLTQCWEEREGAPSCPQCREIFQQENFRLNWQLANIVELVKKLHAGNEAEGKWAMCERHQEPLKLFCKDDQAAICLVCDKSMGHQNHSILPMEEAFLEYKKEIQAQLQFLKQEREDLKEDKMVEDQRSQTFLAQLESEKQKTKSVLQQMHNYVEQKERLRLCQLEEMKGEMEKWDKENRTRFSEEISDLTHWITELEGKFQQPETVFMQDPKTILSRYEKKPERQLVKLPSILEQNLRIYSEQTPELQKAVNEYEESLGIALEDAMTKVNVTLDPETAHPKLILSEDLKSVKGGKTAQNLPSNPERFDTTMSVMGCEKFTSGRHWWEVDLGRMNWAVGIARESVKRKGYLRWNPEEGFWVLETIKKTDIYGSFSSWQLQASTSLQPFPLCVSVPGKIRVLLDYDEGYVHFYAVDTKQRLFTFPSASFSGEALRPYFLVGEGNTLKC